jgi:hypothetical protein
VPSLWCDRFVERLYHIIDQWRPALILVPDVRFQEELDCIKKLNGTVIGLTRKAKSSADSKHASEKVGGVLDQCDIVIDNKDMSIQEQCLELFKHLGDDILNPTINHERIQN